MLNDREITESAVFGLIGIEPFNPDQVQPVSYDLTLFEDIRVPGPSVHTIDPGMKTDPNTEYYGQVPSWHPHTESYTLPKTGHRLLPGGFLLACTREIISLPDTVAARVEGKSSLGRLGMAVHITAGFIDPGFSGQITLEIANLAPWGIKLYAGMPIAQITFDVVNPVGKDYSETGRYQDQRGPVESRYRFS